MAYIEEVTTDMIEFVNWEGERCRLEVPKNYFATLGPIAPGTKAHYHGDQGSLALRVYADHSKKSQIAVFYGVRCFRDLRYKLSKENITVTKHEKVNEEINDGTYARDHAVEKETMMEWIDVV